MPYARLMQELRLTSELYEQAMRQEWVQSAFVGWQVMGSSGAKVPAFDKYLKKLGLGPAREKVSREQVEVEKARAFAALELVERRFDGRKP